MLPNPLNKTVEVQAGAWFKNFTDYPVLWAFPALAVVGALVSFFSVSKLKAGVAIVFSSLAEIGTVFTPLVAMFPFLMPSSSNPISSLTVLGLHKLSAHAFHHADRYLDFPAAGSHLYRLGL